MHGRGEDEPLDPLLQQALDGLALEIGIPLRGGDQQEAPVFPRLVLGPLDRIIIKKLIKVPETVKKEGVRVLVLHFLVLLHHRC